ncbi:MAG: hypothetical protein CMJ67_05610 [Planctomycetaceae bacterium]|nr:hypothetical protein [Planctomycetaceae bacterium]
MSQPSCTFVGHARSRISMIVILVLGFHMDRAIAETLEVCPTCPYTSIQAAIDDAEQGDVIQVAAGVHEEFDIDTSSKAITIQGVVGRDGRPQTIIDGTGADRVLRCVGTEGRDTIIRDLEIRGGSSFRGGGLDCWNTSPTIENCIFRDNISTETGGGISITNGSPVLTDCIIEGNSAPYGAGLRIQNSTVDMLRCAIRGNTSSQWGGGLYSSLNTTLAMTDCELIENPAEFGGGLYGWSMDAYLGNCRIQDNSATWSGGGIHYYNSGTIDLVGCEIRDNTAQGAPLGVLSKASGVYAGVNSTFNVRDCVITGNIANDVGGGMLCHGTATVNIEGTEICTNSPDQVTGNWADEGQNQICSNPSTDIPGTYATIKAAIIAAADGDIVSIGPGTYFEHGFNTQGKAITIEGATDLDGAPATFIDAQGQSNLFTFKFGETADTVVRNLVLTGGSKTQGGGMLFNGSGPRIENCHIVSNSAAQGGGIACLDGSTPILIDCLLSRNDCSLAADGEGRGGGVYSTSGSQPVISRSEIIENDAATGAGGGCAGENGGGITIGECRVSINLSPLGGGFYMSSDGSSNNSIEISDSVICGNGGWQGSGPFVDGGGNRITHECVDEKVPCPGDLNGDGMVDAADLGLLIAIWGGCP